MSEKTFWGLEYTIDASGCSHEALSDKETIRQFTLDLVKEIGMVAYGEPQIVHFGSDTAKGYTLVQLIETSNITAHFSESKNEIYLNVFSCSSFEKETVNRVFVKYFLPRTIKGKLTKRQAS